MAIVIKNRYISIEALYLLPQIRVTAKLKWLSRTSLIAYFCPIPPFGE